MRRENCQMCHCLGDTIFCDYYDVFFMECNDVDHCPDGLDDDDNEDYDYDFDENENENNY